MSTASTTYVEAGVNTEHEEAALRKLTERITRTWPTEGVGKVHLEIGYFANVIEIGAGLGLAISTDGVGTKVLIAQMLDDYSTVGIDCVAMNVNDVICVGARPLSMVDSIAIQRLDPNVVDQIAEGLCEGARIANISISGGEMAQVRDLIKGEREDSGFDIAGTAVGLVQLDKIIVGEHIKPGDVIVGIESSGIHSNGITLARKALLRDGHLSLNDTPPGLTRPLGKELLCPTNIYVAEAMEILESGFDVKALVHITSDGFLNLTRVKSETTGYVIDNLPPIPAIFELIKEHGGVAHPEMFHVFNMGIGFCLVVPAPEADAVISIIERHGKRAYKIGQATYDPERKVHIPDYHLVSRGTQFVYE